MNNIASVFEFDDYKKYLDFWLKQKANEVRGIQTKLAKALQCHPTHITLVLKHSNHLSIEQAGRFSRFAGHMADEALFFQLLLHRDRAADKYSKEIYNQEIKQKIQNRLDQSIKSQVKSILNEEAQATYYSNWIYAAVHMAVSIPSHRNINAISEFLQLPRELIREVLDFLVGAGLVTIKNNEYIPGQATIHQSRKSIYGFRHHANWRFKAIELLNQQNTAPFHYTSVISMSPDEEAKIRGILQEAIDRSRKVIKTSKEEQLFYLGIDWIQVS